MNCEDLMRKALALARLGQPAPNPRVGALVVKNGQIIGQGYHQRRGGPHGEIAALNNCSEDPTGATLFVTLEPCGFSGGGKLTPPCTESILRSGISRVVVGALDPNPKVSGNGLETLRSNGIDVISSICEKDCLELNRDYNHFQSNAIPWVHLKVASTIDGFAARKEGGGGITGNEAKRSVHRLRSESMALLVGSETVKTDNPQLTVRLCPGKSPLRIILNSQLDLDPDLKVFTSSGETWLMGNPEAAKLKKSQWEKSGIRVIAIPEDPSGLLDLRVILTFLGEEGIISLFVESGPQLAASFIQNGLVDELSVFLAGKIWGDGIPWFRNWDLSHSGLGLASKVCVGRDVQFTFRKEQPCLQD